MEIILRGITKKYLLKTALDEVSTQFSGGKIHGLLGENGAGKSTLAKIIAGQDSVTQGQIIIDGEEISFDKPGDALNKNIVIVNQRPLLSPSLTAQENILLSAKKKSFFIPLKISKELSELKKIWAPELPLNIPVRDLGGNNRFYISLLSSLIRHPKFLILDEPSAFLDFDERKKLYSSLKNLAADGTGIIVITHSIAEAKSYCDTITMLNEGKLQARFENPNDFKNIKQIFSSQNGSNQSNAKSSPCLVLENVSSRPKDRPALLESNLKVDYGKITAVAGIKEAALGTLEDFVTGIDSEYSKGFVTFYDEELNEKKLILPRKKLTTVFLRKQKCAIVPSDKNFRASNPNLTVEEMLGVYSRTKDLRDNAINLIKKANVNILPTEKCANLSGGMLQRLILERELSINPRLIILCNPMHGLDIQSQSQLAQRISNLASQGKAILIVGSADFPMTLCSRVYSLEGGILKLTFEKQEDKQ